MHELNSQDGTLTKGRLLVLKRLLVLRALVLSSLFLYAVAFVPQTTSTSIQTLVFLFCTSAMFTIFVWLYFRRGRPVSTRVLTMQLVWDSVVILIFVYSTGRSTNPFIYYLLVIIAISASIFQEKIVWMFSLGGIAAYSLLMYADTHQHMSHMNLDFQSHLVGMWVNFVGSALLISFFISRLTTALKSRERALALAREEILKNEQLVGIGTLAASTVHSFGTPLSTIVMAVGEIEAMHTDSDTSHCAAIIKTQIDRCKQTMMKLSSLASQEVKPYRDISLNTFIEDIQEHFILMNAQPMPTFTANGPTQHHYLPGGILLTHAMINLVENAVQAANNLVQIRFECSGSLLHIVIEDDGHGMAPALLEYFGEATISSKETGLGIGILLANSTIERLNGRVHFANANQSEDRPFTRVVVEIPFSSGATIRDS